MTLRVIIIYRRYTYFFFFLILVLGFRGEIIVDITHSLVVERSYYKENAIISFAANYPCNQNQDSEGIFLQFTQFFKMLHSISGLLFKPNSRYLLCEEQSHP
jgi:hypothetical protein